MEVEIATAEHTAEAGGRRFYFCCARCKAQFTKEPSRYVESLTGPDTTP
jgi:YHS domain-containing protein